MPWKETGKSARENGTWKTNTLDPRTTEGKNNKYVLLNAPNESLDKIIDLLPGMRSPTVLPLADKGWSSIHSVINEDTFWENIEQLREAGAEGILVVPIEKMIR